MRNFLIALGVFGLAFSAAAQNKVVDKFGKGITILGKDSTFLLKAYTRIQSRYDYHYTGQNTADPIHQDRAYVRRARIKFGGFAFSPKVKFKIEHDVLNGVTYDAVVKYNFFQGWEIWAGQTKLPGNRERVISSQKLQFVDRSLLNSNFTLDRDAGIQLRNKHKIGNAVIKEMFAVSQGEGLNDKSLKHKFGHEYTGRIEVLPMGNFTSKGDYFGSDLKREKTPKLAIGLTYDYNQNQNTSRKVKGDAMYETRNVMSIQADFMYKYKGLSIMGEYANTDVAGSRFTTGVDEGDEWDLTDDVIETVFFHVGEGVNIQAGYLMPGNVEVAGRYTTYIPFNNVQRARENQYTFGLSKYVVGHSLKIQTDVTLIEEDQGASVWQNDLIYRLQVELAF